MRPRRGASRCELRAENAVGAAERPFKIVVGDTLALTPPMGWNSWYIHYHRVTEAAHAPGGRRDDRLGHGRLRLHVRQHRRLLDEEDAATSPIATQPGAVLPNAKFPDIKGMVDYIHAKGLQAGHLHLARPVDLCRIRRVPTSTRRSTPRSSPSGASTSSSTTGAPTATWPTAKGASDLQQPYQQMGDILKTLDRDIVLNLCQYGMGDVWKWGGEVGGHCWRTTGDLGLARGPRLPGFYTSA